MVSMHTWPASFADGGQSTRSTTSHAQCAEKRSRNLSSLVAAESTCRAAGVRQAGDGC